MIQLIHEDDVAQAIELALKPGVQGIFNVDGCKPTPLSNILNLAGCSPRSAPAGTLKGVMERLWKMRLTTFPAPELDHLRYVCMVDAQRARSALNYRPNHDLLDTMTHLRLSRLLLTTDRPR